MVLTRSRSAPASIKVIAASPCPDSIARCKAVLPGFREIHGVEETYESNSMSRSEIATNLLDPFHSDAFSVFLQEGLIATVTTRLNRWSLPGEGELAKLCPYG
jgi:hypothetical protein